MKTSNPVWNWTFSELGRKVEPMAADKPEPKRQALTERMMAPRAAKAHSARRAIVRTQPQ